MSGKTKRRIDEADERAPKGREDRHLGSLGTDSPNRARVQKLRAFIKKRGEVESDAALNLKIGATLRAIRVARVQARSHNAELAQLRDETRSLIAEMQRDLNLKVT